MPIRTAVPRLAIVGIVGLALAGCGSHGSSAKSAGAAPSGGGSSATTTSGSSTSAPPSGASGAKGSTSSKPTSATTAPGSGSGQGGGGTTSAPNDTASASGGAEGQQPPAGVEKCTITSAAAVHTTFGGATPTEFVDATGIGNPRCTFTLSSSNVGPGGSVILTLSKAGNASDFAKSKTQVPGAVSVSGVGDNAFYVPSNGELRFIRGKNVVVIVASLRVPGQAQPKPTQLKADAIRLARSVVAGL